MSLDAIEQSYKSKILDILDAHWPEHNTNKELDRAARIKYERIRNLQFQRRKTQITSSLIL